MAPDSDSSVGRSREGKNVTYSVHPFAPGGAFASHTCAGPSPHHKTERRGKGKPMKQRASYEDGRDPE